MDRNITRVLADLSAGEQQAAADLLPLVYGELRKLAGAQMARLKPGQTLQPTAIVHEAYLALVGRADPGWNGRGHFFGAAAQAMREIMIDHVRRKVAQKRGGGRMAEELDVAFAVAAEGLPADEMLAVDAALRALEVDHPDEAKVVVMRYFAGFSMEEIAEVVGASARTIERRWRFARAFLHEALERGAAGA